jgi:hypothetical protein
VVPPEVITRIVMMTKMMPSTQLIHFSTMWMTSCPSTEIAVSPAKISSMPSQ